MRFRIGRATPVAAHASEPGRRRFGQPELRPKMRLSSAVAALAASCALDDQKPAFHMWFRRGIRLTHSRALRASNPKPQPTDTVQGFARDSEGACMRRITACDQSQSNAFWWVPVAISGVAAVDARVPRRTRLVTFGAVP